MHIPFTKMQGAGNDFVVLDETAGLFGLSAAQYRFLADRHFGVGADQILSVRPSPAAGIDFEYVIHNADGGEVEQCGNGARCFARFVRDTGLTTQDRIRVATKSGVIEPLLTADGRVTVDMGAPVFDLAQVPFDAAGLVPEPVGAWQKWPLMLDHAVQLAPYVVAVLSMGNPHAVHVVEDTEAAPVALLGPLVEHHPRFPNRVNAGFMQVLDSGRIRLRVFERGAGETLACGTGACAAVVAGIRLGLLERQVDVYTHGGMLSVAWSGQLGDPVYMTGPATTVFSGEITIPENLSA
ncbi:diaminopimelate epimerase [Rhodoferax koreense]|uniref:Diaminopimelate epimerase n=1 Tax=Rhodoferax koreensis TaxID=1842727 RepID=A0A1P8K4K7_9BURK|nr:diaminopimelate epimerase [Rhodoferax koreense]APW40928.1 diaminopimelate epimerase [Rhodoferax koreense]